MNKDILTIMLMRGIFPPGCAGGCSCLFFLFPLIVIWKELIFLLKNYSPNFLQWCVLYKSDKCLIKTWLISHTLWHWAVKLKKKSSVGLVLLQWIYFSIKKLTCSLHVNIPILPFLMHQQKKSNHSDAAKPCFFPQSGCFSG